MSLLTIVSDTASILGVRVPTSVIGATDSTTKQLLALSNIGGKVLANLNWPILEREATWTTVATELQGDLDDICDEDGVAGIIGNTVWDASQSRPMPGSESIQCWKRLENSVIGTADKRFRVRVNPATNKLALYMRPAPAAGLTVRFAYRSKAWCAGEDRTTRWVTDEDTGIIPEDVLQADLLWRWKQAKKLDYGEEFRQCQEMIESLIGEQISPSVINLDAPQVVGDGFPLGQDESWVT